jgi:hypothetical protein
MQIIQNVGAWTRLRKDITIPGARVVLLKNAAQRVSLLQVEGKTKLQNTRKG